MRAAAAAAAHAISQVLASCDRSWLNPCRPCRPAARWKVENAKLAAKQEPVGDIDLSGDVKVDPPPPAAQPAQACLGLPRPLPRPAQPVNSGLLPPRPGRIGGGKAAGVQCHHREGGQGEGLPATGSDRGDRPTVHSATAHLDALHQAWGGIGLHNGCLHNGRTDALWLAPGRKRRPNGTRPSPALPTLYRSRSRMGRRRRQRRQQPQHQPPEVFHPPATIS